MKRLLLVTEIYPPEIGGPATFIRALARELVAKHGMDVTVACLSSVDGREADRRDGIEVRRLAKPSTPFQHVVLRTRLAQLVATRERVLINGLERIAVPMASRLGRPYALKVVGDVVWETARNAGLTTLGIDAFQKMATGNPQLDALRSLRDSWLREAWRVVTPSHYLEDMVLSWGCSRDRVRTIENGTELADSPRVRRRDAEAGPLKVLFVGRLTNWKGVETLLLAMPRLERVVATVCGDGPEFPHLLELSSQLGLRERVQFTGRIGQSAVKDFMRNADVLVLTSLYEGMSHTLLEAMATGLPCVASNAGGNPETIVDGVSGLLIEPQVVERLVEALCRLEAEPTRLEVLSRGALDHSRRFSFERTTEAYAALLAHEGEA